MDKFPLVIEPEYKVRFIPARDVAALIGMYHIARVSLSGQYDELGRPKGSSKHARMVVASRWYARKHPEVSSTGAYKDLCGLLGL